MGHDQLNILVLKSSGINLLIIFLLVLLVVGSLDALTLSMIMSLVVVVVTRVVVSGVVVGLSSGDLLGGRSLCLGVEILNLGLTKYTEDMSANAPCSSSEVCLHVGIAVWGLEDLWLVDDEEDLRSSISIQFQCITTDSASGPEKMSQNSFNLPTAASSPRSQIEVQYLRSLGVSR